MLQTKELKARLRIPENMRIVLTDKDGNVKLDVLAKNLITNTGMAGLASRVGGAGSEAAFDYLELGTDSTAVAATQTALITAITTGGGARAQGTVSRVTTDVTNDTARLEYTWTFSAGFTIEEIGVFNAASAGTMLSRVLSGTITVVSGDNLQVTHDLDVDAA